MQASVVEAQNDIYGNGRGPPILPHGDDKRAAQLRVKLRKRRKVMLADSKSRHRPTVLDSLSESTRTPGVGDSGSPAAAMAASQTEKYVPEFETNDLAQVEDLRKMFPASELPAGFPPELAFRALAAYSTLRTLSIHLRLSPFTPNVFLRALYLPFPSRLLGQIHVALLRILLPSLHMGYHWPVTKPGQKQASPPLLNSKKRKKDGLKWPLRAGDNLEYLDHFTWPLFFDDYAHLIADIHYASWHDSGNYVDMRNLDVSMVKSDILKGEEKPNKGKVLTKIGAANRNKDQAVPAGPSVIYLNSETSDDEEDDDDADEFKPPVDDEDGMSTTETEGGEDESYVGKKHKRGRGRPRKNPPSNVVKIARPRKLRKLEPSEENSEKGVENGVASDRSRPLTLQKPSQTLFISPGKKITQPSPFLPFSNGSSSQPTNGHIAVISHFKSMGAPPTVGATGMLSTMSMPPMHNDAGRSALHAPGKANGDSNQSKQRVATVEGVSIQEGKRQEFMSLAGKNSHAHNGQAACASHPNRTGNNTAPCDAVSGHSTSKEVAPLAARENIVKDESNNLQATTIGNNVIKELEVCTRQVSGCSEAVGRGQETNIAIGARKFDERSGTIKSNEREPKGENLVNCSNAADCLSVEPIVSVQSNHNKPNDRSKEGVAGKSGEIEHQDTSADIGMSPAGGELPHHVLVDNFILGGRSRQTTQVFAREKVQAAEISETHEAQTETKTEISLKKSDPRGGMRMNSDCFSSTDSEKEQRWPHFTVLKALRGGCPYHHLSVEQKIILLEFLIDDLLSLDFMSSEMSLRYDKNGFFENAYGALPFASELADLVNEDYCAVCRKEGDLLCCDGCTSSFHRECISMGRNTPLPDGSWYCPECSLVDSAKYGPLNGGRKSKLDWFRIPASQSQNAIGTYGCSEYFEYLVVHGFVFRRSRNLLGHRDSVQHSDAPILLCMSDLRKLFHGIGLGGSATWPLAHIPCERGLVFEQLRGKSQRQFFLLPESYDPSAYKSLYRKAPLEGVFRRVKDTNASTYEQQCYSVQTSSLSSKLTSRMDRDDMIVLSLKKNFAGDLGFQMVRGYMASIERSLCKSYLLEPSWGVCTSGKSWVSRVGVCSSVNGLSRLLLALVDAMHPRVFHEGWYRCPTAKQVDRDPEAPNALILSPDFRSPPLVKKREWERCKLGSVHGLVSREGKRLVDWISELRPDSSVRYRLNKRKNIKERSSSPLKVACAHASKNIVVNSVAQPKFDSDLDQCASRDDAKSDKNDMRGSNDMGSLDTEGSRVLRRSNRTSFDGLPSSPDAPVGSGDLQKLVAADMHAMLEAAAARLGDSYLPELFWPVAGRSLFDPVGQLPPNETRRLARRGGSVHAPFVVYSQQYEVGQVCYCHIWRKRALACQDLEELLVLVRVLASHIDSSVVHRTVSLARNLNKISSPRNSRIVCRHIDSRDGEEYFLVVDKSSRAKWISFRDIELDILIAHRYEQRQKVIEESRNRTKALTASKIFVKSKVSPKVLPTNKKDAPTSSLARASSKALSADSKTAPASLESKILNQKTTPSSNESKVNAKPLSSNKAVAKPASDPNVKPKAPIVNNSSVSQAKQFQTPKGGRGRPQKAAYPQVATLASTATSVSSSSPPKISGHVSQSKSKPNAGLSSKTGDLDNDPLDQYNTILLDHQVAYQELLDEHSERKLRNLRHANYRRLERLLSLLGFSIDKTRIMNTIRLIEVSDDVLKYGDDGDKEHFSGVGLHLSSSDKPKPAGKARSPKRPRTAPPKSVVTSKAVPSKTPKPAPMSDYTDRSKLPTAKISQPIPVATQTKSSKAKIAQRNQVLPGRTSTSAGPIRSQKTADELLLSPDELQHESHETYHAPRPADSSNPAQGFQPMPRQSPQLKQMSSNSTSSFSQNAQNPPSMAAPVEPSALQQSIQVTHISNAPAPQTQTLQPDQTALAAQVQLFLSSQGLPQSYHDQFVQAMQSPSYDQVYHDQQTAAAPPLYFSNESEQQILKKEHHSAEPKSQLATSDYLQPQQNMGQEMSFNWSKDTSFSGQNHVEPVERHQESQSQEHDHYMKNLVQNALRQHRSSKAVGSDTRACENCGSTEHCSDSCHIGLNSDREKPNMGAPDYQWNVESDGQDPEQPESTYQSDISVDWGDRSNSRNHGDGANRYRTASALPQTGLSQSTAYQGDMDFMNASSSHAAGDSEFFPRQSFSVDPREQVRESFTNTASANGDIQCTIDAVKQRIAFLDSLVQQKQTEPSTFQSIDRTSYSAPPLMQQTFAQRPQHNSAQTAFATAYGVNDGIGGFQSFEQFSQPKHTTTSDMPMSWTGEDRFQGNQRPGEFRSSGQDESFLFNGQQTNPAAFLFVHGGNGDASFSGIDPHFGQNQGRGQVSHNHGQGRY
ncbi:hypothetical protein ACA910_010792 [Epithemia clementina (nom. ined.)]